MLKPTPNWGESAKSFRYWDEWGGVGHPKIGELSNRVNQSEKAVFDLRSLINANQYYQ